MMLVFLLCVIMKIAELSTGPLNPLISKPPPPYSNNDNHKYCSRLYGRNANTRCKYNGKKNTRKRGLMMEDPQTPGSDCNSNPSDPISQDLIGSEFIQDNSDYQWFIDYGYRDGGLHVHPSVLSSLSTSYTQDDLGYYDDLARNLDANLAEVDMESFRTSDIHTLLTALPAMCTEPVDQSEFNYQRERYASISGSVMEKINIGSSISPHSSSQGEDSACSTTDTISICKSSLLFSPVRETPVLPPGGSYSVDSLDCEDMLLTCQTNNKNNYTIAFEGSITMYSDGSQDFDSQDKAKMCENRENFYNTKIDVKNILDMSMACSDSKIYTTWSNLKHSSANRVMTRHGSGNNNTIPNFLMNGTIGQKFGLQSGNKVLQVSRNSRRSLSLPDLRKSTTNMEQINVPLNFSIDSGGSHHQNLHTSASGVMSRSVIDSANSSNLGKKLQNMSLVKLFMKQKSMSSEGMSLTLDQSDSTSDNAWPTNNNNSNSHCNSTSNSDSGSTNTNTNTNTQIHRKKINHSKSNISENDFAINWVRTECYKSTETSTHDPSSSNNTSKRVSSSMNEFKEESPSVEELSESLIKSEDDIDDKINEETRLFKKKSSVSSRTTGIQAITEVEENGVQTSLLYVLPPKNNFPCLRETLVDKKPVYVVYPNYTLPDLSFFGAKETKLGNISMKPHERISWQNKNVKRGNRPFSCNDIDALKQRGFSHIKDWESLTFLLPSEYRKILNDVPEIPKHIKLSEDTRKPLFCLSPPMRHRSNRSNNSDIITATTNVSSSSSNSTQPSSGYRGSSTILTDSSMNQPQQSNPLYLYRYDSMSSENSLSNQDKKHRFNQHGGGLPEKRSISLPQGDRDGNYAGKVPPRPPLPRSILRKAPNTSTKRYSMFEMGELDEVENVQSVESNKRISLHEPYYINNDLQSLRHGRIIDSDKDVDEVEERRYAERIKETGQFLISSDEKFQSNTESSREDIKQLDEFLKLSGFSSNSGSSEDSKEDPDVKLRSYVRKFLSLKMNKDIMKPGELDLDCSHQKKVSFAFNQRKPYLDSRDPENRGIIDRDEGNKNPKLQESDEMKLIDIDDKIKYISEVNRAVDILMMYWQSSPKDYDKNNECAQLCLTNLCPTLYALMLDGLKPHLNSTFGQISNSVWQVVEVSSQQGPLTNTLNELVQKINSEDFITEGILKFHAFVFGLLNLRALDAWFAYLCTRESILRKHYTTSSLFVAALGCANSREIIDNFLGILQPLAFCPFQLDLLYQYRQLHNSFSNMNSAARTGGVDLSSDHKFDKTSESPVNPLKIRPRSCGSYQDDLSNINPESALKKRWSNLAIGSKFVLDDSEDYTDSLEYSPLNRKNRKTLQKMSTDGRHHSHNIDANARVNNENPDDYDPHDNDDNTIPGELKFRKLKEKWELMGGKEEPKEALGGAAAPLTSPNQQNPINIGKSRIPRLLNSPIKQPSSVLTIMGKTKSPVTGIPTLKKAQPAGKLATKKNSEIKTYKEIPRRTSRVDQEAVTSARLHLTRPSSLPYKSQGFMAKEKNLVSPQRRAASTSLPRPNTLVPSKPSIQSKKQPLKEVRTISHRLPSDNGHLPFNEGDRLKVILEVDNKWLLCAKGDRKGLVPRSCVHAYQP